MTILEREPDDVIKNLNNTMDLGKGNNGSSCLLRNHKILYVSYNRKETKFNRLPKIG